MLNLTKLILFVRPLSVLTTTSCSSVQLVASVYVTSVNGLTIRYRFIIMNIKG